MAPVLSGLHFLTHIALGWLVANLGDGPRKDRCLVVLSGVVLDLDGVGIVWSEHAYAATHRALGHGLISAVLVVGLAVLAADRPWTTGGLAALSFHLHLALDVVGTGGLPIRYFWPFADWAWSYSGHWVLASWPNVVVMILTLLGVAAVAWRRGRTPLECLSRRADERIARRLRFAVKSAVRD